MAVRFNAPGLSHVGYRIGTYGSFYSKMKSRVSQVRFPLPGISIAVGEDAEGPRVLAGLTTRDADDPTIAMLDAWAVVADILTFYQERIANEGWLKTATERFSVVQLAREIGYEPDPGQSAEAYLAFIIDDSPLSPGTATIPAGTKIQSVPQNGELPQTFETSADTVCRAEWNLLKPQLTDVQVVTVATVRIFLSGAFPDLKVGINLLVVDEDGAGKPEAKPRRVTAVSYDDLAKVTTVDLDNPPPAAPGDYKPRVPSIPIRPYLLSERLTIDSARPLMLQSFRERDLGAMFGIARWEPKSFKKYAVSFRMERPWIKYLPIFLEPSCVEPVPTLPDPEPGVFSFKQSVGIFGNTAPLHASLPADQIKPGGVYNDGDGGNKVNNKDWDAGRRITRRTSDTQSYQSTMSGCPTLFLERIVPEVDRGQWILLNSPEASVSAYRVASVQERGLNEFAISGRSTGLRLVDVAGVEPKVGSTSAGDDLKYDMRSTTVSLAARSLPLAPLAITSDLGAGTAEDGQLTLEDTVLGLNPGQVVILSGERRDLPGVVATEAMILSDVVQSGGRTTLSFTTKLQNPYLRSTVTMSANVATATHGETVPIETLGHGNGGTSYQWFNLRKSPLTYVPASTPTGTATSLGIRVNGILWSEAPNLFVLGSSDRSYIVRIQEDQTVTVTFGDGVHGAPLPSGTNNITANYRTGIGAAGRLPATVLSLLMTRPPGVRSVSNPLPTSGGVDPESLDSARVNAPRTVLTFGRIVSRKDLEDFARGFAGVGKAAAQEVQRGERGWLLLTVGSVDATPFADTDPIFLKLQQAVSNGVEPSVSTRIATYSSRLFVVTANLRVDPANSTPDVLNAAQQALLTNFAFGPRSFGQPVTLAEVVATLQNTPGVVSANVIRLRLFDDAMGPDVSAILRAAAPSWTGQDPTPGELLTIHPLDVVIQEDK